jgi:hypothetical protein
MIGKAITPKELARELEQYPEKMRRQVSFAVRNGLVVYERHHKKEEIRRGAGKSGSVEGRFTSRTGALAKSYRMYWSKGDLEGWYGSESKYSAMIEKGGKIKPTRAQMLAIPLSAAKYGVGGGVGPRHYDNLFMIKSRKGNLLLAKAQGAGIVPMFVLKKQVKIPARPTIERTEKAKTNEVHKLIADAAVAPFGGGS